MNAFLAALLASFFLSLQGALMATHYRKHDELSIVAYRGLSLGISFAPLLLFVPVEAYAALPDLLPLLLIAALLAGVANTFAGISNRILVISVANTVAFSTVAFVSALIDAFYYGKYLTASQIIVILLLFITLYYFSRGSGKHPLVRERSLAAGLTYSVLFGIVIAIAFALVGELSKKSHPLLIGYCWEILIGLWTLALAGGRRVLFKQGIERISLRKFRAILIAASPTALGTALYLYALSTGQLALVSALLSTTMVFSLLMGALIYSETFGAREALLLVAIAILIAVLKIISPL